MRVRNLSTILKWQHQGQSLSLRNCARVEVRTKHGRCSGSRWRCQDAFTAQPRSPRGTKPAMIGRLILSSSGRDVGPKLLCTQGSGCLFPSLITHLRFCIGLTWLLRFLCFLNHLFLNLCASRKDISLFLINPFQLKCPTQTIMQRLSDSKREKVLPWWCEVVRTPQHRLWERYSVLTVPEGRANSSLLEGYVIAFRVSVLCSSKWYFVFPPKQLIFGLFRCPFWFCHLQGAVWSYRG